VRFFFSPYFSALEPPLIYIKLNTDVNKPFYSSRALNLDVCQACASRGITPKDVAQSTQAPATTTGGGWTGSGSGSNTSARGHTVLASPYKDVSGVYPALRPQQTAPSRMSAVMRAPYCGDSTDSGYGSSKPAGEFPSRDVRAIDVHLTHTVS